MAERRDEARRRVCLGGLIETASFLPEIPCLVRDVSLAGARIRVAADAILPERLVLRVPHRNEKKTGRVVWRMGDAVGLLFEPDAASSGSGPRVEERDTGIADGANAALMKAGGTLH